MNDKLLTRKNILIFISIFFTILLILAFIAYTKNQELILQGEIEAKTINIASKIAGRVNKINVEKGDEVQKDEILLELDMPEVVAKSAQSDAMLELALYKQEEVNNGAREEQKQIAYDKMLQAKTGFELAQKTYNRVKKLNEEGVLPTQKFDEAEAQYKNAKKMYDVATANYNMYKKGARAEDKKMAQANVNRAKGAVSEVQAYLNENKVKSPIKGQVTDILTEIGEIVPAGFTIITITDNEDSWVVLNLREDLLSKIKMGSKFEVKVPAIDEKFEVEVNYISPLGSFATNRATKVRGDFDLKTFEIHAKPTRKVEGLRAGMTVVVDWGKVK